MSRALQQFEKYAERGAYHWKGSSATPWWARDVQSGARYQLALRCLQRFGRRGGRGVDVGCGDGVALFEIGRAGYRGIGVDGDEAGLAAAASRLAGHGGAVPLLRANVTHLPFGTGTLDFALSLDVIEHLGLPAAVSHIAELARVTCADGVVVVTTPRDLGRLRDPYHLAEFTADRLADLLGSHFGRVLINSYNDARLARLYRPGTRMPLVNRACALAMRTVTSAGVNTFARQSRDPERGLDLVAVALHPL